MKEKNVDEMKLLTEKFVQHMVKTLTEMKARHMRELLTFAKLTPQRKTTKLNRKMTSSATLSTKNKDMMANISRCLAYHAYIDLEWRKDKIKCITW